MTLVKAGDPDKIGDDDTYIEVDTDNHEIRLYVNGELKEKWTE